MLKRLFCLISAFAVLFFASVPVGATGMEVGGSGGSGGIGIPVVGNINFDVVDLFDYMSTHGKNNARWLVNTVGHFVDEDICPNAPQVGGGHNFVPRRTMKDGQVGRYYVCEYCGKAYGEAMEEAYQDYVDTLPGTQYNSDGSFLWTPTYVGLSYQARDYPNEFYQNVRYYYSPLLKQNESLLSSSYSSRLDAEIQTTPESRNFSLSGDEHSGVFLPLPWPRDKNGFDTGPDGIEVFYWFVYPVTGTYTSLSVPQFDITYGSSAFSRSYPILSESHSSGEHSLRRYFSISPYILSGGGANVLTSFSFSFFDPVFLVKPSNGGENFSSQFPSDSRPSIFADVSGDNSSLMLGYMDNGNLVQSQSQSAVFSESANVYTNPVTNNTKTVTNWDYDYTDRSYTLTTNEGNEIIVTYGDANLTINEGDETYTVYYLAERSDEDTGDSGDTASGSGDNGQSDIGDSGDTASGGGNNDGASGGGDTGGGQIVPHTHSYSSDVIVSPTCTGTGVETFACSCGDIYTRAIPVTGHIWSVLRSVPTQYDADSGELLQQGYTLYECETCGEQYRIDAASGGSELPMPSSVGVTVGDSGDGDSDVGAGFLLTIARGLTEDLPEVLKMVSQWFTTIPALFDGYSKFLAASFGWMPEECVMLIVFGVHMVVLLGILKACFRR